VLFGAHRVLTAFEDPSEKRRPEEAPLETRCQSKRTTQWPNLNPPSRDGRGDGGGKGSGALGRGGGVLEDPVDHEAHGEHLQQPRAVERAVPVDLGTGCGGGRGDAGAAQGSW